MGWTHQGIRFLLVPIVCGLIPGCVEVDPLWSGPSDTDSSTGPSSTSEGSTTGLPDPTGSTGATTSPTTSNTTNGADGQVIFVTAATYNGNLGGIAGADEICATAADAASLGGTWRAFLATTTETAVEHANLAGPLRNMNGELVANDPDDLFDGELAAIVSYSEYGTETANDIWTGTSFDGTVLETCQDWAWTGDNATKGTRGLSAQTDGDWIYAGFRFCDWSSHLYCVSQ